MTPTDRLRTLLARAQQQQKTPILDATPGSTAAGKGVVKMRLYEPIDSFGGEWGVSAKEFGAALDALPDDTQEIRLHINSPGGEVFEAIAILNQLRNHQARVVTVVDGLAASGASVVAMAGDELVMSPNTELMIHDAWGICIGNAEDMRELGTRLDKISNNIADVYARKAGGDVEDWRAAMLAETWYSADEAVEAGLADRVQETADADPAQAKARFDLSIFNYAGRAKAPTPPIPAASACGSTEKQEDTVPFTEDLRKRLGITDENADEATILAALDEVLAEQAGSSPQGGAPTPTPTAGPAPQVETQPVAQVSSGKLPAGAVVIDQATLDSLQASARRSDEVVARLAADERDRTIEAAVRDGKITPARVEHWRNAWKADPEGAKQALASMPKNMVPVSPTGSDDYDVDDSPEFASLFPSEQKG